MIKAFAFVVFSLLLVSCTQPAEETAAPEQASETAPSLPQQEAVEQPAKAEGEAEEIKQLLEDDLDQAISDLEQLK